MYTYSVGHGGAVVRLHYCRSSLQVVGSSPAADGARVQLLAVDALPLPGGQSRPLYKEL